MDLMKFLEENWFQITLIITIIGTVIKLTTRFDNSVNENNKKFNDLKKDIKDLRDDTNDKIDKINKRLDDSDEKRNDGQERTRLIMEGVEATLISLKNEGHNGPVTASLEAINAYKLRKASE